MTKLQRVLIMAGGTGGHVFPGLVVANALRDKGVAVSWLGTRQGLEAKLVPEANIPIHYISIGGVRGKGLKTLFLAPFRIVIAVWQALKVIRNGKPDVIIGMGGFVSGPGGIASRLLGYPLVIHEQNARPGTTNKWLSRVAKKVLEGFPDTFTKRQNVVPVGNPIRKEIANTAAPDKRGAKERKLRLLVLGGSLGASALNLLVPETLKKFPENVRPEVRHQTGEKHLTEAIAAYNEAGVHAEVLPFIKAMDQAYQWADMVICRAGALTIAELCASGLGAILVPYPHAIDDHQTANAEYMTKQGAALLIQQKALNPEILADTLQAFIQSPETCRQMGQAAFELRKTDATEKVLEYIYNSLC